MLFILGPPGTGKGTQCGKLVKEKGFIHLSAGDLLREEKDKKDSPDGKIIENCIKEGKIVPVKVTVTLLWKAIEKNVLEKKNIFLVDGFPRNKDNVTGKEKKKMKKKKNINKFIRMG